MTHKVDVSPPGVRISCPLLWLDKGERSGALFSPAITSVVVVVVRDPDAVLESGAVEHIDNEVVTVETAASAAGVASRL